MMRKGIAVLVSALVLSTAMSGCGKETVLDGTETAATLDDTVNMTLGEFNLMLRYQQAQMESTYASLFGTTNFYGQDSGTGTTYGETAKESLLEQFQELYVLEAEAPNYGVELTDEEKAAITEAAVQFVEDNTEKTRNALGADQASVERLLTLATIQDKMYDVLTADVDTEVSDEEAAQKRISYVFVSTQGTEVDEEGNTVELTEEEKQAVRDRLQAVLDDAAESGDLAAAIEAANEEAGEDEQISSATEITYGADTTTVADVVKEAADQLSDGEIAPIVETDTGYYGVQMLSTYDEEATAAEKENIIQERRNTLYQEQCAALEENHTFTTVDSALDKLTFDRVYYVDTTATGTDTGTESETETDTGTESETETDAAETGAESETDAAAE